MDCESFVRLKGYVAVDDHINLLGHFVGGEVERGRGKQIVTVSFRRGSILGLEIHRIAEPGRTGLGNGKSIRRSAGIAFGLGYVINGKAWWHFAGNRVCIEGYRARYYQEPASHFGTSFSGYGGIREEVSGEATASAEGRGGPHSEIDVPRVSAID